MTFGEGLTRPAWRIAAVLLPSFYAALLFIPNSDIAGGSDSSGYLNAARLFSRARVSEKIEVFGMLNLPASDREVFIPLGFRPGAEPGTMAPSYPPGLPLHMAAAAAIGGWSAAPFLVVPLSALAVLFLFYTSAGTGSPQQPRGGGRGDPRGLPDFLRNGDPTDERRASDRVGVRRDPARASGAIEAQPGHCRGSSPGHGGPRAPDRRPRGLGGPCSRFRPGARRANSCSASSHSAFCSLSTTAWHSAGPRRRAMAR